MPKYLITLKISVNSCDLSKKKTRSMAAINIKQITRKIFHESSSLKGLKLILIDQICECIATPTIMNELIKEMSM